MNLQVNQQEDQLASLQVNQQEDLQVNHPGNQLGDLAVNPLANLLRNQQLCHLDSHLVSRPVSLLASLRFHLQ